MDGEMIRCAHCGALVSGGRFCTNCGALIGPAPTAPGEPAYDDASTNERLYAVPDQPLAPPEPPSAEPPSAEPVQAPPLFRDELYPQPPPQTTVPAEAGYPGPPPPRRSPGAGLWVGAAAGLAVVLVLGAYLLLSGGGGGSPSTSATPLLPPTHHTKSAHPSTSTTSSAPTTAPTKAATGPAAEVAGLAHASAPSHAPAGVDFAGRTVTYVAPNMVDGVVDTCWRTPGDATGTVLTFRLDQPTRITKVGLINGYAKTAYAGGRRYDWYQGDRRILSVDWVFDDGSSVSQLFSQ